MNLSLEGSTNGRRGGPRELEAANGGLLANACLDVFYKQSTIAFTTRTILYENEVVSER